MDSFLGLQLVWADAVGPVPAAGGLQLADTAAVVKVAVAAGSDTLDLADAGQEGPLFYRPGTGSLHLGDAAAATRLGLASATGSLHLGDAAAAVKVAIAAGGSGLDLVDTGGGVVDRPAVGSSALVLADAGAVSEDYAAAATTTLVLADGGSELFLPAGTFLVAAASHLDFLDRAAEHYDHPHVLAVTTLVLADPAAGADATPHARPAGPDGLVLSDRADVDRRHEGSPTARAGLVLADRATLARDVHVAATSSMALVGPDSGRRGVPGPATTTLHLADAATSNHFDAKAAAGALHLADHAAARRVPLGVTDEDPNLVFRDRADARISLVKGGGPPGHPGCGLADVLAAGLDEDAPCSFAETPSGLVLVANGVDPMLRWDVLAATAGAAGVPAPAAPVALGGFGVGPISGTYTAYQRFLSADGTPGNLSPVSNSITCGADGPIEGVTFDAGTGAVTVLSFDHGLATGDPVTIAGVEGVPTVNGTFAVTVVDADRFRLRGLVLTGGTYTAGGTWTLGVQTIAYSDVEAPTDPRVARRQLLRNLDGDATVYYVDVDTDDLAGDTFFSAADDEALATGEGVPIVLADETPYANSFGLPPSHKACLAAHLGRIFAAGEVTVDRGSVATLFRSVRVRGVGTAWKASLAGRLLYVVGAARSYEVAAVDEAAQTLTLTEPFGDPAPALAPYAIRPAPGERRLVYYSEPALPESWPAWDAVAFPEDGDEITGLLVLGSFLYVLERRHIYKFTFQADPADDGFVFLATRRGCVNHRCHVQAEDHVYLLDEVGIHRFDGGTSEPISTPIQALFQQGVGLGPLALQVNWTADRSLWHAAHDPVRETIRWFVSMSGSRAPRHAIAYDYRRGRWWIEEYPRPLTASAIGTVGYRRSLAGTTARRVLCLSEGTLDGVDPVRAARAAVTSAGPLTLTDAAARFPADLAGVPVQVVAGRGAGQARVIVASGGTTLAVDRPWRVRPDATSTYQVGGVPWRWRSGWYAVAADEAENPRDLELVYQPLLAAATADAQLFYDHATRPRAWAFDRDQDGVAIVRGEPTIRFALDTPRGYARHRLAGHQDVYAYGDAYVSVLLAGVQATEEVRVFSVVLKGAT